MPILALMLLFVSGLLSACSGGGSDAPQSLTAPPGPPTPPAPAGLIYRTDTAFVRSQTDGSSHVTLADAPGLDMFTVFPTGSTIVYQITAPPVPALADFGLLDIWQVQTNGTGTRAVAATQDAEIVRDVFGPWVVYEHAIYAQSAFVSSTIRSARLDGTAQHLVTDTRAIYQLHLGDRAVFTRIGPIDGGEPWDGNLFSILPDGTDQRTLTTFPIGRTLLDTLGTVGNQVIFRESTSHRDPPDLFTASVLGGSVHTLVEGPDYKSFGAVVGNRIAYHRCAIIGPDEFGDPIAGPCDLYSVNSDGSGTIALATQPDNETVVGVVDSRLIVQRSDGGPTDTLFSIAADGRGGETPIITLVWRTEFVLMFVEDRIILQRPSGLWSVRNDGSDLVQLTDTVDRFSSGGSTGPFACFSRRPALWCVPADGSGPATKVTDNGQFVTGL